MLNVIKGGSDESPKKDNPILTRQRVSEALFERRWLQSPNRFIDCSPRIERSTSFILKHLDEASKVVDLGSGYAQVALMLAEEGYAVHCTDIAAGALKKIPDTKNITKEKQGLPLTTLADDAFDTCLALDVIAELNSKDFRLSIAEMCRIINTKGTLFISSPIDIHSEDALTRFCSLIETEFKIHDSIFSYHAWSIRLKRFFCYPQRVFKRSSSILKLPIKLLAGIFALLFYPITFLLSRSCTLSSLEKMCKFVAGERGISHALFFCKKRALFEESDSKALPDRAPFMKEVMWE